MHFICPVHDGNKLPLTVQISTTSSCKPQSTSGEIAVGNRHVSNEPPTKKIGVCLQGVVRQFGKHFLETLVDFIRTCQVLGADFVTMYASPDQLDSNIIDYLVANYSHIVNNMVKWETLEMFNPVHYFGQLELMHDCMFRHMYEVEYIALFDLDEMILPFKQSNWPEMLKHLKQVGGKNRIGYLFLNRFYVKSNQSYRQNLFQPYQPRSAMFVGAFLTTYPP